MTVKEATQLVLMALATMPNLQNKDLAPTAKAWAMIMPDVTFQEGQAALIKLLRERKIATIPLPGEIIEAVESIRNFENQEVVPTDYEAWQEVRKKIVDGRLRDFSHDAVKEAVETIGRLELMHSTSDMSFQFMKTYSSIIEKMKTKAKNKATLEICCGRLKNLLTD